MTPLPIDDASLRGRRVLVTGASGFVGGRLAERLCHEHRCDVIALIRNWSKAVWVSRYPVTIQQGDVRDLAAVQRATAGCATVFHCASGGGSDAEYLDINIRGCQNILQACRENGVRRLVFVSTIAVHGPNPPDGADERDSYRSMGRGYSASKIEAEKMVFEAGREFGLEVVILRPTFVWGPRSSLFTSRPLKQLAEGSFRLVDKGAGSCHAVFIEHLVDALIAAAVRSEAVGKAYLVTDGYGMTWKEFFATYQSWLNVVRVPSMSSTSHLVKWRCRLYQLLQRKLEDWKENPAPLSRKVLRRLARSFSAMLAGFGVMNEWDLIKFARRGSLNTSATARDLGIMPRYAFHEAMSLTEAWVRDQMALDLPLATASKPTEGLLP